MRGTIVHEVRPHTTDRRTLLDQKAVYEQGRTPSTSHGSVTALDIAPAGPERAARDLGEIAGRFGPRGLGHSIRGLDITRGRGYTDDALRMADPAVRAQVPVTALAGGSLDGSGSAEMIVGGAGPRVAEAVGRSGPGGPVPAEVTDRLPGGGRFAGVRVHDDEAAHTAASLLHARAFTIGRSVYLGRGERPDAELMTHELAHTAQQGEVRDPVAGLPVSAPGSAEETEAHAYAEAARAGTEPPAATAGGPGAARISRVIGFSHANDVVTPQDPGVAETAATFQIGAGVPAAPYFRWTTDVTISGNAGDPFADFQVGPQQVVRAFWLNVFWGTDANRSHLRSFVPTPIRDTTSGDATWYDDGLASGNFGAAGDVRSTSLDDTPGVQGLPLANPVAGRTGTRGWWNWGMAFVAFIEARDTTAAGGAGFRPIAHVYWNLSLAGTFDTTQPVGSQVTVTSGGTTNVGGVIEGGSGDFPARHAGATFNPTSNANVRTT